MLEIMGQEFDFDITCPDDMERFEAAHTHFQKMSAEVEEEKGKVSTSQYMRGVCQCAIDFFNGTLGDGAAEKILGSKISMVKCIDAASELSGKLVKQMEIAEEKFQQFSPDRLNQHRKNE